MNAIKREVLREFVEEISGEKITTPKQVLIGILRQLL
jgi:hypothetical protein